MSYDRHKQCGSSRLPVLLKISKGREVLVSIIILIVTGRPTEALTIVVQLFFHGVTVATNQPYVFFTNYHHHFTAVPIGSHAFPRQVSTSCDIT